MNAGAYKSNMASIIQEVFVYRDGQLCWMDVNDCEFAYRTSIFQKQYTVLCTVFSFVRIKYCIETEGAYGDL